MSEPNLTERETSIIRLRDDDGLSWSKIGERLGTTRGSVNSSYRAAKIKLDRAANPDAYLKAPKADKQAPKANSRSVEVTKPDETAELLDIALEPYASIGVAAEACGFPKSTARNLMQRMAARYKPLRDAIKPVKDEEMILLLEDRARRALLYCDDFVMAGAPAQALMTTAAIAIDKARLLKGEPTAITRLEDIRQLDEVGELLMAEMKRRGKLIDVTPEPRSGP